MKQYLLISILAIGLAAASDLLSLSSKDALHILSRAFIVPAISRNDRKEDRIVIAQRSVVVTKEKAAQKLPKVRRVDPIPSGAAAEAKLKSEQHKPKSQAASLPSTTNDKPANIVSITQPKPNLIASVKQQTQQDKTLKLDKALKTSGSNSSKKQAVLLTHTTSSGQQKGSSSILEKASSNRNASPLGGQRISPSRQGSDAPLPKLLQAGKQQNDVSRNLPPQNTRTREGSLATKAANNPTFTNLRNKSDKKGTDRDNAAFPISSSGANSKSSKLAGIKSVDYRGKMQGSNALNINTVGKKTEASSRLNGQKAQSRRFDIARPSKGDYQRQSGDVTRNKKGVTNVFNKQNSKLDMTSLATKLKSQTGTIRDQNRSLQQKNSNKMIGIPKAKLSTTQKALQAQSGIGKKGSALSRSVKAVGTNKKLCKRMSGRPCDGQELADRSQNQNENQNQNRIPQVNVNPFEAPSFQEMTRKHKEQEAAEHKRQDQLTDYNLLLNTCAGATGSSAAIVGLCNHSTAVICAGATCPQIATGVLGATAIGTSIGAAYVNCIKQKTDKECRANAEKRAKEVQQYHASHTTAMGGTVNHMGNTVNTMGDTVNTMGNTVNNMQGEVGGMQGRIGGMQGQLGGVQGQLGGIQGQLGGIQGQLHNVAEQLDNNVPDVNRQVQALQTAHAETVKQLQAFIQKDEERQKAKEGKRRAEEEKRRAEEERRKSRKWYHFD